MDRVKYFRDRSSRNRAREERQILEEEFKRTIRYYGLHQSAWISQAKKQRNHGSQAYAFKQAALLGLLADQCIQYQNNALEKGNLFDKWYVFYIAYCHKIIFPIGSKHILYL